MNEKIGNFCQAKRSLVVKIALSNQKHPEYIKSLDFRKTLKSPD
jgi:hypothetical protein